MTGAALDAAAPAAPATDEPRTPAPRGPKTWTQRRSDEVVLQVWRCIANAGPMGISPTDIRARLRGIEEDALRLHLAELRRKGHVRFNGVSQHGCWVATAKHPLTEDPPIWLQSLVAAEAAETAPEVGAEAVVTTARQAVPNSIFAVGAKAAAFGVDIDAAHMPAAHKAAMAAATPPSQKAAAPEAPRPPLRLVPAGEPTMIFALASDKTLNMVHADGRCFRLTPEDTRALFAYLDSLMAIGHGSLSEATS